MKKFIVANWKMNGSAAFMDGFVSFLMPAFLKSSSQITICPPFPLLGRLQKLLHNTPVLTGAQNCHAEPHGAFTGEVSAAMLAGIGCRQVIAGHSERRSQWGETDSMVRAKAAAIHQANMAAIICVGENLAARQAGQAIDTVTRQVLASLPDSATPHNTLIAYEPVWAIGTGAAAAPGDITTMHREIFKALPCEIPLLYGGSVTRDNSAEILCLPHVDGILIGGASLKKEDFEKIICL